MEESVGQRYHIHFLISTAVGTVYYCECENKKNAVLNQHNLNPLSCWDE